MPIGTIASLGLGAFGAWRASRAANKSFNDFSGHSDAMRGFQGQIDHVKGLDRDTRGMMNSFADPNRGLEQFLRLGNSAAPSRSDMMALSANTGGSTAAAGQMAQQGALQASNQALTSFGQHRLGLDSLMSNLNAQRGNLANLRGSAVAGMGQVGMNKDQMKQADFNQRRDAKVSLWSNVSSMGFGLAGNRMGQANGFMGSGSQMNQTGSPMQAMNPGQPQSMGFGMPGGNMIGGNFPTSQQRPARGIGLTNPFANKGAWSL